MSEDLTEDEVRELIREEIDGGRSIGRLSKLLLASTLILTVIAIPVLGDVNIRDTGDLVLRDETHLDLKSNSRIKNLPDPQLGQTQQPVTLGYLNGELNNYATKNYVENEINRLENEISDLESRISTLEGSDSGGDGGSTKPHLFLDTSGNPYSTSVAADRLFDWNQDNKVNGYYYTRSEAEEDLDDWHLEVSPPNPFFDNTEPLSENQAADVLFDWNQDGIVDGLHYTEGEMSCYLDVWENWEDGDLGDTLSCNY